MCLTAILLILPMLSITIMYIWLIFFSPSWTKCMQIQCFFKGVKQVWCRRLSSGGGLSGLLVFPQQRREFSSVPVGSHWDTQSAGAGFILEALPVIAGYSGSSHTHSQIGCPVRHRANWAALWCRLWSKHGQVTLKLLAESLLWIFIIHN